MWIGPAWILTGVEDAVVEARRGVVLVADADEDGDAAGVGAGGGAAELGDGGGARGGGARADRGLRRHPQRVQRLLLPVKHLETQDMHRMENPEYTGWKILKKTQTPYFRLVLSI